MKILFVCSGEQPDYQCDVIYHGLKTLYGTDVECLVNMWYMYSDLKSEEKQYLYGLGFTLYGLLSPELRKIVEVKEVMAKVRLKYYDFIIYGSIQRNKFYLGEVLLHYPPDRILFIDGEDFTYFDRDLYKRGVYFKRELLVSEKYLHSIGFGIPGAKILTDIRPKTREWSYNYPGKLYTYIYREESAYYQDYQQSKYAVTFKKAGWDCLRHYEIIANASIPYFKGIEHCPRSTLVHYPKEKQYRINKKIERGEFFSDSEYFECVEYLLSFAKNRLTTEAIVKDMFNSVPHTLTSKTIIYKPNNQVDMKIDLINQWIDNNRPTNIFLRGISTSQSARFFHASPTQIWIEDSFRSVQAELVRESHFNNLDSLGENMFDLIVLDRVMDYSEEPQNLLINIRNLMRSKARLIVIVNNFKTIWQIISIFQDKLEFGHNQIAKSRPVHFYSYKSLSRLFKMYGFEIERVYFGGQTPGKRMKLAISTIVGPNKYSSSTMYAILKRF